MRVYLGCFVWGNVEECGIEVGDVVEYVGRECIVFVWFVFGWVLVEIGVEVVGGDFGDGVVFVV